jgi:hypothetical protein
LFDGRWKQQRLSEAAYTKRAAGRRDTLFSTSLDTRVFAQHTANERDNALTSLFRIRSSFAVVCRHRSCEWIVIPRRMLSLSVCKSPRQRGVSRRKAERLTNHSICRL